ncbi:MAG: hypothetical protein ACR2QK_05440, partial [Acidimicrobiales bacterium]
VVDWAGGEPYRTSLPNGDVLIIERIDGEYRLTVSGNWLVDPIVGDRWFVSDLGIGVDVSGSTIFEIQVDGDEVRARLLDEPPLVSGPDRLEVEGVKPVRSSSEEEEWEPVETEPGDDAEDDPSAATGPSSTVPETTSTVQTTTSVAGPTTTVPPTTAKSTTTTTKPSTTTRPPRTTTTRPPRTTTTSPPTTVCDDDDDRDDGFDGADDDDCDD